MAARVITIPVLVFIRVIVVTLSRDTAWFIRIVRVFPACAVATLAAEDDDEAPVPPMRWRKSVGVACEAPAWPSGTGDLSLPCVWSLLCDGTCLWSPVCGGTCLWSLVGGRMLKPAVFAALACLCLHTYTMSCYVW